MKNKRLIFIIAGAFTGIIVIIGLVKINDLNRNLSTMKMVSEKNQKEAQRLSEEKDRILKEKEKLQADTVSFLATNSQLQSDKDRLQKGMDELKKTLDNKEIDLQLARDERDKFQKLAEKENMDSSVKLNEERAALEKKVRELEQGLKKGKSTYYYNIGVIYAQQGNYQDAIDSYKESLKIDPDNTAALYNLTILYDQFDGNPKKALECYKKLLQLNPNPEDVAEIREAIQRLEPL